MSGVSTGEHRRTSREEEFPASKTWCNCRCLINKQSLWLDLNAYHPEHVAQTLTQPMLFLLGGSDYQVTREDFHIWQDALGGRDGVQFLPYPGLSHTLMLVEGGQKVTPATYAMVVMWRRRASGMSHKGTVDRVLRREENNREDERAIG